MYETNQKYCPHCNRNVHFDDVRRYYGYLTFRCCSCRFPNRIVEFLNSDFNDLYRAVVEKMKEEWEIPLQFNFTDHSPKHSARVLEYCEKILLPLKDSSYQLCQEEFLILVLAGYLHDSAMQRVDPDISMEILDLWKTKPKKYKEKEETDGGIEGQDRLEGLANLYNKIRIVHGVRSKETSIQIINEIVTGRTGAIRNIVSDIIPALQFVCDSHSGNPEDLPINKKVNGKKIDLNININGKEISTERIRLLAGVLRFSDELDISKDRVHNSYPVEFFPIGAKSALHWLKHMIINWVRIDRNQNVNIKFRIIGKPDKQDKNNDNHKKVVELYEAAKKFQKRMLQWVFIKLKAEYKRLIAPNTGFIREGCGGRINLNFSDDISEIIGNVYESKEKIPRQIIDYYWDDFEVEFSSELDSLNKIAYELSEKDPSIKELLSRIFVIADEKQKQKILRENPGQILSNAFNQLNAKDYGQAMAMFKLILKEEPNNLAALIGISSACHGKEYYDKAIKYLEQGMELNPGNDAVWINLGAAYNGKKDYDKAIEYLEKARELNPDNDSVWGNLGVAYNGKKDYDKAIKCLEKAIDLNPGSDSNWSNLGAAYFGRKNYDKAIECLKNARELNSNNSLALVNLGAVYSEKMDYDKAIKHLEKAVELNSDSYLSWNNLGAVYNRKKNYNKAIECLDKAILINPEEANAYAHKGKAMQRLGRLEEAEQCYIKSLGLDSEYYRTNLYFASLYAIKDDKVKALEYLKKAIDGAPDLREEALEDEDFKSLWNDSDFIKLIGKKVEEDEVTKRQKSRKKPTGKKKEEEK